MNNNSTTLIFRNSKQLRDIAEEILAVDEYRDNGYTGLNPNESRICLVKDDGVYLMSGAKKSKVDVSYAIGLNPKTNDDCHQDARDAVGGDDFCDYLPIDRKSLEVIIEEKGYIKIEFTQEELEMSVIVNEN